MSLRSRYNERRCGGSAVVIVTLLLAAVSISIGAILLGMQTFMRHTQRNYCYERAVFLNDAGMAAALVELNRSGDGIISASECLS